MTISSSTLASVLRRYGFRSPVTAQETYLHYVDAATAKLVVGVTLADGRCLVIKLFRDTEDFSEQGAITETQSAFSELLRTSGISTPKRYRAHDRYCTLTELDGIPYHTTLEDWCGHELTEIRPAVAHDLGILLAQMHLVALNSGLCIGRGTIFGEAPNNDHDAYPDFCRLAENTHLDASFTEQIQALYTQKAARVHALWDTLPQAATQGDLSVNNLVLHDDGTITVFDYNIAGDEVLVSDLVLEGLFLAYQMDIPPDAPADYRETIFPAFYDGYLSVRPLTAPEREVAWALFTMYHSLWATVTDALESLVTSGRYAEANAHLARILADLSAPDDGRFAIGE